MLRKAFLATSALVVASSMAFANGHRPATHQALKTILQEQRTILQNKGFVLNPKGVPIGIKMEASASKAGAIGKPASRIPGGGGYNTFSKSKNALFLSWFGWFGGHINTVSGPYSGSFCYSSSYNGTSYVCINHYKYYEQFSVNLAQSAAQPFKTKGGTATTVSIGAEQYTGSGGAQVGIYSNTPSSTPGNPLGTGSFSTAPAYTGLCCSGLQTVTLNAPVTLNKKTQYWVVVNGNGSNGRVAWNGQDSNFTAPPTGEDYKYVLTEVINTSYKTTARDSIHGSYHTTIHESSGGWIHTSSFTFIEQQAAFSVN